MLTLIPFDAHTDSVRSITSDCEQFFFSFSPSLRATAPVLVQFRKDRIKVFLAQSL